MCWRAACCCCCHSTSHSTHPPPEEMFAENDLVVHFARTADIFSRSCPDRRQNSFRSLIAFQLHFASVYVHVHPCNLGRNWIAQICVKSEWRCTGGKVKRRLQIKQLTQLKQFSACLASAFLARSLSTGWLFWKFLPRSRAKGNEDWFSRSNPSLLSKYSCYVLVPRGFDIAPRSERGEKEGRELKGDKEDTAI